MTKKKPGAVRGRPKGSGMGYTSIVSAAVTPEVEAAIIAEADARGVERSVVIREILERWARRRARA